jgi:nitroreductase
MEFLELARRRRSVRAYAHRDVDDRTLTSLLECIRAAPSAGNLQAFEVLLVRDARRKQALTQAALGQDFLAQAPVLLAFFANRPRSARRYRERGSDLYSVQDATIACAYAQLAATSLGLATCWVGAFDDEEVCRILAPPEGLVPVALLPVGYAGEQPEPAPRRPLASLVHREHW